MPVLINKNPKWGLIIIATGGNPWFDTQHTSQRGGGRFWENAKLLPRYVTGYWGWRVEPNNPVYTFSSRIVIGGCFDFRHTMICGCCAALKFVD